MTLNHEQRTTEAHRFADIITIDRDALAAAAEAAWSNLNPQTAPYAQALSVAAAALIAARDATGGDIRGGR